LTKLFRLKLESPVTKPDRQIQPVTPKVGYYTVEQLYQFYTKLFLFSKYRAKNFYIALTNRWTIAAY